MSGIVGSRFNTRGSGVVGSLGSDGQIFTSSGGGVSAIFEAAAGGGKLLQVVSANDTTGRTITSTGFEKASNTLDVAITPASTDSKIYIVLSGTCNLANGTITFYRGGSNLMGTGGITASVTASGSNFCFLDSPNSTSEQTYEVYAKAATGVGYFNQSGGGGFLHCFEIGG